MKTPKLLPWKARRANVSDQYAEALWSYVAFVACAIGKSTDYQLMNAMFDRNLAVTSAVTEMQRAVVRTTNTSIDLLGAFAESSKQLSA